jgi:hypothetical protein
MLAMGAHEIPRQRFLERLRGITNHAPGPGAWRFDPEIHPLDPAWSDTDR